NAVYGCAATRRCGNGRRPPRLSIANESWKSSWNSLGALLGKCRRDGLRGLRFGHESEAKERARAIFDANGDAAHIIRRITGAKFGGPGARGIVDRSAKLSRSGMTLGRQNIQL